MALTEGIGTRLYVSTTLPTTYDQAGYEALTWTEVCEIAEIPEFGQNFSVVTFTSLKDGTVNKFHGENNAGSLSMPIAVDHADAGQDILRAAIDSKAEIAFRVAYSDGTTFRYTTGKVMGFPYGGSVGSVVQATAQVEFTRPEVLVTA